MGRGHADHGDRVAFAAEVDRVDDAHEVLGVEGTVCQICAPFSGPCCCASPAGNG